VKKSSGNGEGYVGEFSILLGNIEDFIVLLRNWVNSYLSVLGHPSTNDEKMKYFCYYL
jgi:hypothetical protein